MVRFFFGKSIINDVLLQGFQQKGVFHENIFAFLIVIKILMFHRAWKFLVFISFQSRKKINNLMINNKIFKVLKE